MSDLSTEEVAEVVAHIADRMGLCFPPSKHRTLDEAFRVAARELGFRDQRECVAWFLATPPTQAFIETMAGYLTIGETYFFREPRTFDLLEREIIPAIIRNRERGERHLRIWSAGCATGEEPYTIAIILHRLRDLLQGWELAILATDINPQALAKAREGVYTEWSFRNTPPGFKEHYFHKSGAGRFTLLPRIREMVNFAYLNLVEDIYPSLPTGTNALDVIFCRNVLMYFTPERAREVVSRFHHSLLDQGWLLVSPCEAACPIFSGFTSIHRPEVILLRKEPAGTTARVAGERDEPMAWGPELAAAALPIPSFVPCEPPDLPQPPAPSPITPPPRPTVTPYEAALALYGQGGYQEAASLVESLLDQQPGDTRAMALLARIYANEGRLGEALTLADQALAQDKLNAGLHYLRAVILQEKGLVDEAVAALRRALYLDQEMVVAHFTLGNLSLRLGKGRESRKHFANALALLAGCQADDPIPESDGMPAGRVREIIRSTTQQEA